MGDEEGCDPEEELEDDPISSSVEGRRQRLRIIMSPTPKVQMQRYIITSTMDNNVNMKTFYRQQFQAGGIQCLSCGVSVPIPTQYNSKLLSILKKLVFQPAFLKRVNSSINFKKNPSLSPFQSESHWVEYLCTSFCSSCASELKNMVQLQMEIERLQSRLDTMVLGVQDLIGDSVHPPQILGHPDNDDDMDEDEQEISSLTLRSPIHTDRANDPEEEDMISSDFEVYVPSEVEIENADTDSEYQVVHVPKTRRRSSRAAAARGSDKLKVNIEKDRESVKKVFSQPGRKNKHKFSAVKKNTRPKFVLCPTCGKTILAVSFKEHEKRMHLQEYPFKCDKCSRGIGCKVSFEEHMQLHTALDDIGAWPKGRGPLPSSGEEEDVSLCCSLCHRSSFQDLSSLFTHQVTQHANLLTRRFLCTFCGKAFLSSEALKQHERGIHPQPSRSNNNDTLALSDPDVCLDDKVTFPNKTKRKSGHSCILCSAVFTTVVAFRGHAKHCPSATEDSRQKQCLLCGELFQKVRDKEEHFRRVHRGLETFKCPHCPLKFPRLYEMLEHASVHTADKPVDCDKCGKAFSTVKAMRRHQVHYCALDEEQREKVREAMRQRDKNWRQRAKQVFCPFCRKGYIETGHLNEHMKKHHPQSRQSL